MDPEVTLTLSDEQGRSQQIAVHSKRFTIGRSPDNDLVIDDVSLSRRHAVIESFDGVVQISDCGSQNGTFLNGSPITSAAVLKDGDVISVGYACRIMVHISARSAKTDEAADECIAVDNPNKESTASLTQMTQTSPLALTITWLSDPVNAAWAMVIILLATVPAIILLMDNSKNRKDPASTTIAPKNANDNTSQKRPLPPTSEDAPNTTIDQRIEDDAREVIGSITTDKQSYFFPSSIVVSVVGQIKREVDRYSASLALAEALRSIKQHSKEIAEKAPNETVQPDSIELNLATYAALAKTDGGQKGNPVEIARKIRPCVRQLIIQRGTGTADSSLIVVADSLKGCENRRRLLGRIDKSTDRTVWNGTLDNETYNFVIRFLALGVIAQNPGQYGVAAPRIEF